MMELTKNCRCCKTIQSITCFSKSKASKDGLTSRCKICDADYYIKNKSTIKEVQNKWRLSHTFDVRNRQRGYMKKRRQSDINFKLVNNLRVRIRLAIKHNWKSGHTLELLGCNITELKQHLEVKFTERMNWDNYGKWHIDHIIPCYNFDLSNVEDQYTCFHYTNLQPLWAIDNIKKGAHTHE